MARQVSWIPTVTPFLLLALHAPASASHVVVPDSYPTIQAAINSGADSVAVRDGVPPERLTVSSNVTLEPFAGQGTYYDPTPIWVSMPRIQSLALAGSDRSLLVRFHGIHFLGTVKSDAGQGSIEFEGCRFDSGLVALPSSIYLVSSIRGCTFLGNVNIAGNTQFNGNTVIGGTATICAYYEFEVGDNYITGPANDGLRLQIADAEGVTFNNTIRNVANGIHVATGGNAGSQNDIADCSANGILFEAGFAPVTADSNLVQRCGGAGILALASFPYQDRSAYVTGNVVLHTGGAGIDLDAIAQNFSGNHVFDAGGNGIRIGTAGYLARNVVGRCGGDGILITGEPYHVANNTVFGNGGVGIDAAAAYAIDSLLNNVSAFNTGAGFRLAGVNGGLADGCNDWFGNLGGATVGFTPAPTDLQVDPLFCSVTDRDVHLAMNSPLLSATGCGVIGALGQGCGAITAVGTGPDVRREPFRVWPVPARNGIGFELPRSVRVSRVEVFDVTGASRWRADVPAGAERIQWDGRDDAGRPAAAGVYFARLTQAGATRGTVRLVLAR